MTHTGNYKFKNITRNMSINIISSVGTVILMQINFTWNFNIVCQEEMVLEGLHSSSFLDLCVSKTKSRYFVQHRNFISNACTLNTLLWVFLGQSIEIREIRWQGLFSPTCPSISVSTFVLHSISRTRSKGWNLNHACTSAIQLPSLSFCCLSVSESTKMAHFKPETHRSAFWL